MKQKLEFLLKPKSHFEKNITTVLCNNLFKNEICFVRFLETRSLGFCEYATSNFSKTEKNKEAKKTVVTKSKQFIF